MFALIILSKLPLWVLYGFSNFLGFMIGRVFRYRKKVVLENLRNSFPEKNEKELRSIARGFYRNLSDIIVETIKGISISKQELVKRVKFNNWSLFIVLTISIPAIVLLADSKSLKPNPWLIRHLINRWSCSTILFRYLHCLISIFDQFLLLYNWMADLLDPLLSMLISSGIPLFSIALFKNLWAENLILFLVSRKSTVLPFLSTALYKYLHTPLTLM